MSPAPDERDRIRAAMDRILRGASERSNGALTIVALALEAGVPRNALTQRHTDLKKDFYSRSAPGAAPRTANSAYTARSAGSRNYGPRAEEIAQLKAGAEALVGALHQTAVENGRLRHQLTDRSSVVRTLPAQAPFPSSGQMHAVSRFTKVRNGLKPRCSRRREPSRTREPLGFCF
jgi:hypothetical protein